MDLDKIVDNEVKKGVKSWEFLQSGLSKCRDSEIPSEDEENAIRLPVRCSGTTILSVAGRQEVGAAFTSLGCLHCGLFCLNP